MTATEMFTDFIDNLKIAIADQIGLRYGEIASSLNKKFRDSDSNKANSLQVFSYGRWTAIKGVSNLDMLHIMPNIKLDSYKNGVNQRQPLTMPQHQAFATYEVL